MMSDINREQLEAQLRAAQDEEARAIMEEIKAILEKHGNRYELFGRPRFQAAGNGAWIITVDVGIASIA